MPIKNFTLIVLVIVPLVFACETNTNKEPLESKKVYFKKEGDTYTLYRNGKPYYIKGAAGHQHINKIKTYGGNSIRTWGGEKNTKAILDSAWKHGLSVTVGLYISPLRHGFNYNDPKAVKDQKNRIKNTVNELKGHPAVLMWALGNELEHMPGDLEGDIPKMYESVNDLAQMIHDIDPDHPVSTMIVPFRKTIRNINKYCPDIDILGFNSFSGLHSLKSKVNTPYYGWNKPYIVSEWGSPGWWEAQNTLWDMPLEETSTKKAVLLKERYESFIAPEKDQCIGSYVFYWGFKQEKTATWFSMFDPDGNHSETVLAMHYLWTGENQPFHSIPKLQKVTLDGQAPNENVFITAEKKYQLEAVVDTLKDENFEVIWEIKPENEAISYWGEKEKVAPPVFATKGKGLYKTRFTAPKEEGAYRAYCYIYNKEGGFATGNFPFYVLEYENQITKHH
ncbi:glycoside hydrolase family 2 TIM barrel-domain containing protein [Cytophagaceae bacterium ABcell3]|nr:glycoside hydrolase family 2 TIM barrel-domain containing protein [Cytophagaceae bacterium ABcell3]